MLAPRIRLLVAVVLVVAGYASLDRLVYSGLIFAPPHHAGWDQFRWYVFERQRRRVLAAAEQPGKPLVIFAGSSVAKYSVQKRMIERELDRLGRPAQVELLVHASMMPVDLRHYLEELAPRRRTLIVYLLNPADLDLERYLPPWEAGPGYDDLALDAYLTTRHPMLLFYPGRFAWSTNAALHFEDRLRLFVRGLSPALRFRGEWWDPTLFNLRAGRDVIKSYLYYQGADIPEGLWRDGRTGACFRIARAYLRGSRPLVEVVRELAGTAQFGIEVYSVPRSAEVGEPFGRKLPRARLCRPPGDAIAIANIRPERAGWQELRLPELPPESDYFLRLSHVQGESGEVLKVTAGSHVHIGRGLRLPGHFGLERPPTDAALVRRAALEDLRLALLSESAYVRDFQKRVHPEDWARPDNAAIHQFNRLRLAKLTLHHYGFEPIPLAREIEHIARRLPQQTSMLIVNNPENPLTVDTYRDSDWYRGYLAFLQRLAESDRVEFADEYGALRMQDFSDAHHLTTYGVRRMAPRYAGLIARALGTAVPQSTRARPVELGSRRSN